MTEGTFLEVKEKEQVYIVVVDGEPEVQRMLKRILELEGYAVSVIMSNEAALSLLETLVPDLVILNIAMSDHDSLQVLDLVKRSMKVPVIMLTVRGEEITLQEVRYLGVDDYVGKPFHTQELLARVRRQLRRAGQHIPPSEEG